MKYENTERPMCPVLQWMLENGQSPDAGFIAVLPSKLTTQVMEHHGPRIPFYVRFSPTLNVPVIMKDETIRL